MVLLPSGLTCSSLSQYIATLIDVATWGVYLDTSFIPKPSAWANLLEPSTIAHVLENPEKRVDTYSRELYLVEECNYVD